MNKTAQIWEDTKTWCRLNPGKEAAIVTPEGTFIVVLHPPSEQLGMITALDHHAGEN